MEDSTADVKKIGDEFVSWGVFGRGDDPDPLDRLYRSRTEESHERRRGADRRDRR